MELLVGGSPLAWEQLVSQYARLIRASVKMVLVSGGKSDDESLVDDLTAELFSALLGNNCAPLRAYQGRSSLATYLRVIAVRVALRYLRDRREQQVAPVQAELVDHRHVGPEQMAMSDEQQQALGQLIQQLPQRQREMIRLHYFEGYSYAQISRQLQVPIGSIGPTLQRAEQRLRESLNAQSPSSSSDGE